MRFRKEPRRLSRQEEIKYLECLTQLQAEGIPVELPYAWQGTCRLFDVMVGPPGECVVWDRPNGGNFLTVYLRMLANQSGLRYPDFEIETSWDNQIVLASVDENKLEVAFGGQRYPRQEILNSRIEDNEALPRGRVIFGYLLATGIRPIPAEHGNSAIVPFNLTLRDPFSGDILQAVQGRMLVSRCGYRLVAIRTGLYGGGKPELSPEEESSRRYREILKMEAKPVFRELTPAQRLEENMRYAALLREEAWREKAQRLEERAWQRRSYQEETVPTQSEPSPRQQPQGGEAGPAGSPLCVDDAGEKSKEAALKGIRRLNLTPETQVMFEKMLRSC